MGRLETILTRSDVPAPPALPVLVLPELFWQAPMIKLTAKLVTAKEMLEKHLIIVVI